MRIEEVRSTKKKQRVATHTQIKGLGLAEDSTAIPLAAGLKQVISAEKLQCFKLMAEKGMTPLTMKAKTVKAMEECFLKQFTYLYQNSDIEHIFPFFLDVFNAALMLLNPKHKALANFAGCSYDPKRPGPWNCSFRHVAYACVTYYEQPHLLAETQSERKKRSELVMQLYRRVVAEGLVTLQEVLRRTSGAIEVAPACSAYMQRLLAGDDASLLDFGRQWLAYIRTVKDCNSTGGHPSTIAETLNCAEEVLEHVKLYEQAVACWPDLVEGIEGLCQLSLAYTKATATIARKEEEEAVAAVKATPYVPMHRIPKPSTSPSAATSEDEICFFGD